MNTDQLLQFVNDIIDQSQKIPKQPKLETMEEKEAREKKHVNLSGKPWVPWNSQMNFSYHNQVNAIYSVNQKTEEELKELMLIQCLKFRKHVGSLVKPAEVKFLMTDPGVVKEFE